MSIPPLPMDEAKRLEALRRYLILDSEPEPEFDEITKLAQTICETPIALVSLVDEHRQWFKARQGLDTTETPREHAFCAYTILQDNVLEVPNALADDRFVENPLVTGEPSIRFYAGMPLITSDGFRLGSLCVIDREPRALTPMQTEALRILGRQVISQIELRFTVASLAESVLDLMAARDEIRRYSQGLVAELSSRKEQDAFIANVSHELRTPLNAIIGLGDILIAELRRGKQPKTLMDDIQSMRTAGCHLLRLVNQILDLAKLDADQLTLNVEEVDVGRLVDSVVQTIRPLAMAQHNRLNVRMSKPVTMRTDITKLTQVLYNVLSNACKYTERGEVEIVVTQGEGDGDVHFAVRDTGMGIPADQLERIFDRFTRLRQGTGPEREGAGLGLALTRSLCRRLDGRIEVASEPGKGSVFTVILPKSIEG